jgi:hypothetical protein
MGGEKAEKDEEDDRKQVADHGAVQRHAGIGCVDGAQNEQKDGSRSQHGGEEEKTLHAHGRMQHLTLYVYHYGK